jgi:hypothetical protein
MEERIMNEHNPTDEENQEPALAGSNQQDTGDNSADGEEARIVKRKRTPWRLVERVTALRGLGIAHPRDPKSMLRRQTLVDIKSKDAEICKVRDCNPRPRLLPDGTAGLDERGDLYQNE